MYLWPGVTVRRVSVARCHGQACINSQVSRSGRCRQVSRSGMYLWPGVTVRHVSAARCCDQACVYSQVSRSGRCSQRLRSDMYRWPAVTIRHVSIAKCHCQAGVARCQGQACISSHVVLFVCSAWPQYPFPVLSHPRPLYIYICSWPHGAPLPLLPSPLHPSSSLSAA